MTTPADPWPAPRVNAPVDAVVTLPGSKSLTNRALVLAAIADGPSVIRRALRSRDTTLMAAALTALGSTVDTSGEDWKVSPGPFTADAVVDCGLAGTVMRFVPPVAGLSGGAVSFDGDPHMRSRPIGEVLGALRALGVDRRGRRPRVAAVHGPRQRGGHRWHRRRRRVRVVAVHLGAAAGRAPATSTASTCATTASRCRRSPTST